MNELTIFWFRRDLRLDDNHGLFQALQKSNNVLPIFIFDSSILNELERNDARVSFIHHQIEKLNKQLFELGRGINVYHGNPISIFKQLVSQFPISKVVTNKDYEPYALKRDYEIQEFLGSKNIAFELFKDHVIFEKDEILKQDQKPYLVYTPYSKRWLEQLNKKSINIFHSGYLLMNLVVNPNPKTLTLETIGFKKTNIQIPNSEIFFELIDKYEENRNFPSIQTSKLGIHLRFGTISVRKLVKIANESLDKTFLKELIWREFFIQILGHFPNTITNSFKPKYDAIFWRNNKEEFESWCQGKTGYPIVDAGMRELNTTGFMHNRVRMITASFLCKHLLIDWRWGEAYFAKKLLDFELASNVGNWQWVAGCGVDAAPYFRIFNPTAQTLKFDKEFEYIKQWVPEFQELSYPSPIIEHSAARNRCLEAYRKVL